MFCIKVFIGRIPFMTRFLTYTAIITSLALWVAWPANAQFQPEDIPGSADAGRIGVQPDLNLPDRERVPIVLPEEAAAVSEAPAQADGIFLTLSSVRFDGATVYSPARLRNIFEKDLGQEVPLSRLWEYAAELTDIYKQDGYFLSRAFVPAQEIDGGNITIGVVEGYIADIIIEGSLNTNNIVSDLKTRVTRHKPIKFKYLESTLLRLDDVPGVDFEAVLTRAGRENGAAVDLTLRQVQEDYSGSLFINNHGSRFTGPHRVGFAFENSFIPLQSTSVSGIANIPGGDEVWSLALNHTIQTAPEASVLLSIAKTISEPGFTLAPSDVESRSFSWSAEWQWQAIRQRHKNLEFGIGFEAKNVDSDILDTALTRDRIRTLKGRFDFEIMDFWNGSNFLSFNVTRGLKGLDANAEDDDNISRDAAQPDFTKITAGWSRQELIHPDWLLSTTAEGQYASKALYSSEEFGVGGPRLGRAYDTSEITGDHGLAGSVEMIWTGFDPIAGATVRPSFFYDIGKIWNIDQSQETAVSISSLGAGIRFSDPSGLTAQFSIAQPLSKGVSTPLYGGSPRNPRLYFKINQFF